MSGFFKQQSAGGLIVPNVGIGQAIKFPFLHRALAQVAGGVQDRKLLFVGDSIVGGDFVASLTGQGPAVELAKFLSGQGITASADGLSGAQPNTAGGFVNDPRWTAGAGWSLPSSGTGNAGPHNSWAGEGSAWFAATGTANTLAFKPSAGFFDHADVYSVNVGASASGFSVNFNGGTDTVVSTSTVGITKTTVSGSSTARPNINMHATTGAIGAWIIGVECYLSTTPTLRIGNVGMGGANSTGWIDGTNPTIGPLASITAYAPDVVLYSIGVNDANASFPVSLVQSNITTFVNAMHALAGGCDVILMTDNPCLMGFSATAFANQAGIANGIIALGPGLGCPTVDIFNAWGGQNGGIPLNADGFYVDAVVHPSIQGQTDQGLAIGRALLSF